MREIGGEFWETEVLSNALPSWWEQAGSEHRYYVSGRTALEAVIRDMKISKGIHSVCIPSYCCDSMVTPFIRNEVDVQFYSVNILKNKVVIDISNASTYDSILVMDYFGFDGQFLEDFIKNEHLKGHTIIQDSIHSLLQPYPYSAKADYIFLSFRKWSAILGAGVAIKKSGRFLFPESSQVHEAFIHERFEAKNLKRKYLLGEPIKDEAFLSSFRAAEMLLEECFSEYGIDNQSKYDIENLNLQFIREKRSKNALFLIEEIGHLCEKEDCSLLFSEVKEQDCPLFVPLLVPSQRRTRLRDFFINNQVYCPVHWPLTANHSIKPMDKEVYAKGISLICDQRYTVKDMFHQVELIQEFFSY